MGMPAASGPVVSIVTIAYNQAHWIERTAASVLHGDQIPLEWIVVDNGSHDGTFEWLQELARRDERVRVLAAGENLKQSEGLRRGLDWVRGAFVATLDGDDVMLPGRLERPVAWLGSDPKRVAVWSEALFVDSDDRPVEPWFIARDAEALRRLAEFSMPAIHSSGTWRTEALRTCCEPLPIRTTVSDYFLLTRALEIGEVGWLADPTVKYRVHPNSDSQLNRQPCLAIGIAFALLYGCRSAGRPTSVDRMMAWADATGRLPDEGEIYAAAARQAWIERLPRHALYYARRAVKRGQWNALAVIARVLGRWPNQRDDLWPILRGGLLAAAKVDGRGHSRRASRR